MKRILRHIYRALQASISHSFTECQWLHQQDCYMNGDAIKYVLERAYIRIYTGSLIYVLYIKFQNVNNRSNCIVCTLNVHGILRCSFHYNLSNEPNARCLLSQIDTGCWHIIPTTTEQRTVCNLYSCMVALVSTWQIKRKTVFLLQILTIFICFVQQILFIRANIKANVVVVRNCL